MYRSVTVNLFLGSILLERGQNFLFAELKISAAADWGLLHRRFLARCMVWGLSEKEPREIRRIHEQFLQKIRDVLQEEQGTVFSPGPLKSVCTTHKRKAPVPSF